MKLKSQLIWPAILLIGLGTNISAQSLAESFLNRLQGTWQGAGKSFGMDARSHLRWEWVLGNKFLRLSIRNEMRSTSGQSQVFEGHAYYQVPKKAGESGLEARWFDSRGVSFPIKANIEGEALVAFWGSPDQEEGKSVYRLIEPARIEVVDSVKQKDGTWREFGRFVVVKK